MSTLKIAMLDKRLLTHLELGGDLSGDVSKQLIAKIVKASCNDPKNAKMMAEYGFSTEEVCYMYIAMIATLMPNPCIKAGTRMLAASLPMMEEDKFSALMSHVNSKIKLDPDSDRRTTIYNAAGTFAEDIWEAHTQSRGEASFSVKQGSGLSQSGCMSALLIASLLPVSIMLLFTIQR